MLSSLRQLAMLGFQGLPDPPPVVGIPGPTTDYSPTSEPSPDVTVTLDPTAVGAPGRQTIQDMLDWLGQYALWACVAAIVVGGGMFAWGRRQGGHGMALTGTTLVAGGAVGTILVGLAPEIVNTLFDHS